MTGHKLGVSPSTAKKIWTAPAMQVIELNAAKNGPSHGTDGGTNQTKS